LFPAGRKTISENVILQILLEKSSLSHVSSKLAFRGFRENGYCEVQQRVIFKNNALFP